MKYLLGLFLFVGTTLAQTNSGIFYTPTVPVGACNAQAQVRLVTPVGDLYDCSNGTWTKQSTGGSSGSSPCGALGQVQLYATATTFGCNSNFVYSTAANTLTIGAATVSAGQKINGTGAFSNLDGAGGTALFWSNADSGNPWAYAGTVAGRAGGFGMDANPNAGNGVAWEVRDFSNQGNGIQLFEGFEVNILSVAPAGKPSFAIEGGFNGVVNNFDVCLNHPAAVDVFSFGHDRLDFVCHPVLQYTSSDQVILPANSVNPFIMVKNTQAATAPAAGNCDLRWVAGTNAGTGKLVAACGTSATEVTIVDNVGVGF